MNNVEWIDVPGHVLVDEHNGDTAERIRQLFEPTLASMEAEQVSDRAINALIREFLGAQVPGHSSDLEQLIDRFGGEHLSDESIDVADYIQMPLADLVRTSTHTASPRFIGHMTSALPYYVRPFARLIAALNQNVVKVETAHSFTPFERHTLALLHQLIYAQTDSFYAKHAQCSTSTLGIVTSGGTIANITALWCARNAALGPQPGFGGVVQEGLPAALEHYGYSNAVIVGSALMHYSFDKAADLLGIGRRNLIRVPADHRNRIDVQALRETLEKCHARKQRVIALVGVAGATDSGGIDPLRDLAALAKQHGVHCHVDAAWGGPLLFSARHRSKLAGIDLADSVTFDAHKQLYTPIGIGVVCFRDPALAQAIEVHAAYTVRAQSSDLGKRALEGTRPPMSLFLHTGLKIIGPRGYAWLIDEGIRKTQYMADRLRCSADFELLAEPDINILLYRFLPVCYRVPAAQGQLNEVDQLAINRFNERLQKTQRKLGCAFISRTTTTTTCYGPHVPIVALRAVIANPLTTERDIDAVLDEQRMVAALIAGHSDQEQEMSL